jgi:hypothetical protein
MVLDSDGWSYVSDMPVALWRHCIVSYEDSYVLVMSGFVLNVLNVNMYMYDFIEDIWFEYPTNVQLPR